MYSTATTSERAAARRVLVLGGSGFVGCHVVAALVGAGLEVRTVARRSAAGLPGHVQLDLTTASPGLLGQLLEDLEPDVVVNCAGATAGDPALFTAANAIAPANLVAALRAGGRARRFVHLGSAAEYGRSPSSSAVTEDDPTHPVGPYGESKLAGTLLVGLGRAAGLDAVVLRVFNPIGPGASATTLCGRLAAALTGPGEGPVRLGPLEGVRDFVDVRDVADAVVAAVTATSLPHGIVNVGSGKATPVRTLVDLFVDKAGTGRPISEDAPGSTRSAGVMGQCADVSRALADLGWKPQRRLEDAVADYLEALK